MIKVFSGKWRGLDGKKDGIGMILSFQFRDHIHHFEGSSLQVFLCISLHSDEDGHSFPSIGLLEKETGLSRMTVCRAIDFLCKLEINDHRVLTRYRERDSEGKYIGSNHYLIFPEKDEIKWENDPEYKNDTSPESNFDTRVVSKLDSKINQLTITIKNQDSQNEEKPKKPAQTRRKRESQEGDKKKGENDIFPIASALAHVTGMPLDKNRRLYGEAKRYYKKEDIPQILSIYGVGGIWYRDDWRGKKGQRPSLQAIRETWDILKLTQAEMMSEKEFEDHRESVRERIRAARDAARNGMGK